MGKDVSLDEQIEAAEDQLAKLRKEKMEEGKYHLKVLAEDVIETRKAYNAASQAYNEEFRKVYRTETPSYEDAMWFPKRFFNAS